MKNYVAILMVILFCLCCPVCVFAADKVVVVIDPGHGGYSEDKSAYGAIYNDGLCEKDINLATSLAIKKELEKYYNVDVYLTREDDSRLSLEERVDFAKRVGADIMVSCHYNASESHLFYGSEIFTSAFGSLYVKGNSLGQCIMEQWIDDGLDPKGIKVRFGSTGEDYYGVIRHGAEQGLPVIIIEHGYLDNHFDYERLGTEEDWERMGRLDATGIAQYYGLSKDGPLIQIIPDNRVDLPDSPIKPDVTDPEDVEFEITDLNIDTSEVTYEISAKESDGKLMYYGISIGDPEDAEPSDYADLILWEDGKSKMTGTYSVPTGYKGKITARVYNTYELYTDSVSEEVDMLTLLKERAEILEEEAKLAAKEAREAKEKAASEAQLRAEKERKAAELEEVGDYSFMLGGKGKVNRKKGDGISKTTLAVLIIVIGIALSIFVIVALRKQIYKFITDREDRDFDRY